MFLLKTRHAYREIGPTDRSANAVPRVVINLPGPVSRDEWSQAITIEGQAA